MDRPGWHLRNQGKTGDAARWRVAFLLAGLGLGPLAGETPGQESPRRTMAVEVIRRVEPGVVALYSDGATGQLVGGSGSGSLVGDGYILTNDHVVKGRKGSALIGDMPPVRYELVGRLPEKDLALVRVAVDRPRPTIPLGRSHDLRAGEPALVGGNPGGRGIVFSSGIISSPSVLIDSNALVAALSRRQAVDRFIQVDAAVNPGNSGGALINAEGVLIGVITRKMIGEDNVGYAIPIDRVRASFRDLAAPEERGDCWTGLTLDPMATEGRVIEVKPGGPADKAGLRVGDRMVAVAGKPLSDGISWLLALIGRKSGDQLPLGVERSGEIREMTLELDRFPLAEVVPATGKSPGLQYEVRLGELSTLVDLNRLEPIKRSQADGLDLTKLEGTRAENYAVTFSGYLEIPETGVYQLVLNSDDGSRLFLDGSLAVDNDGDHPPRSVRAIRRLGQGLHPLRLEYFQGGFGAALGLRVERDLGSDGAPIALRFFRD